MSTFEIKVKAIELAVEYSKSHTAFITDSFMNDVKLFAAFLAAPLD